MMRDLKPVFRMTLSQQVATQIAKMISEGRWKTGEKLPSEAVLCQTFHVGRSTLREALKSLAFVGMVHMKAGEGTYVGGGSTTLLGSAFTQGLLKTEKDLDDLCEVRFLLEKDAIAHCARHATSADIARLQTLVSQMKESIQDQGDRFLVLDVQFHLTIADASQNRVLAHLLRAIRDLLQEVIMKSQQAPGARELAYAQHLEIVKALKQHNPRQARAALRDHLKTFQRAFKIVMRASIASAAQSASPETSSVLEFERQALQPAAAED